MKKLKKSKTERTLSKIAGVSIGALIMIPLFCLAYNYIKTQDREVQYVYQLALYGGAAASLITWGLKSRRKATNKKNKESQPLDNAA